MAALRGTFGGKAGEGAQVPVSPCNAGHALGRRGVQGQVEHGAGQLGTEGNETGGDR